VAPPPLIDRRAKQVPRALIDTVAPGSSSDEGEMRVTVTDDQIRAAFEAVKDDPSFDESRGLWERGHAPVEMLQAMALRPEILRAFGGFGSSVYPGGLLERRIKELVIITASRRNDCQFCTSSNCDLVDIADIVDEPLALVADPASLPPRERLAIQYTTAVMADSNNIPDEMGAQLKEQFSDPELVELTFLIGYINMLNLFNNALGVRYGGEYQMLRTPVVDVLSGPARVTPEA
jgi:alkylhydroperoxidase family enzyme